MPEPELVPELEPMPELMPGMGAMHTARSVAGVSEILCRSLECVCVHKRERESVCVCMCVCERERDSMKVCVCVCKRERECVCAHKRETPSAVEG